MESEHGLTRMTRTAIVAVGVLQGLICFLISKYAAAPAANIWQVAVLPATMAVSVLFVLSVFTLRQWKLWGSLAIVFLAVLGMGFGLQANISGLDVWVVRDWIMVFYLHLLLMQMLLLPWLQHALFPKTGEAFNLRFYRSCWHNSLTLLLVLLSNGLFWLLMYLWGELFRLVGIQWFSQLFFDSEWFPALATGLVTSLTIILARSQQGLIKAIRNLLSMVAVGLLPLVAVLTLLFLAVLPFVGLESISQRTSAAGLLVSVALIFLLLATLADDPQRPESGYPGSLNRLNGVATFVLPVYPMLALWALWLRVEQYSWSPDRLYGVLIIPVVLLWSLGRCVCLLRRNNTLVNKGKVTSGVCLLSLGILVLLHTPLLDVWKISVNSHLARYHAGLIKADQVSLYMLSHAGNHGREALEALRQDEAYMADPKRNQGINEQLLTQDDYNRTVPSEELKQHIEIAPNRVQPDDALWQAIGSERYMIQGCLSGHDSCVLTGIDLNRDNKPEWVLWQFTDRIIMVYGRDAKGWKRYGLARQFPQGLTRTELLTALNQKKVIALPSQWDDISLFSERIQIDYQ